MRTVKNYFALSLAIIAFSFVGVSAQTYQKVALTSAQPTERQVYKKLLSLPRYGVFDHITYQVSGDTVILGGKTITLGTRAGAERIVKNIPGVANVVNNIDELPLSSFDDRIRRAAYVAFVTRGPGQYFSTIDPDVRIIVENGNITLEGNVAHQSDANLLTLLARGISGVFDVKSNLVIGRNAYR